MMPGKTYQWSRMGMYHCGNINVYGIGETLRGRSHMTLAGKGEGVHNADATVNFACKMTHFVDGGGWGRK